MHGGDIYRNKVNIDFSVNINPLGLPLNIKRTIVESVDEIMNYPDMKCEKLREKLAEYHGIDIDRIICGNGASEIIRAICEKFEGKTAVLIAPGFSGYIKELKNVNANIKYFELSEENDFNVNDKINELLVFIKINNPDIMFITNPNNPTGRVVNDIEVKKIADTCKVIGCTLVIDECFIELTSIKEEATFVKYLNEYENVMILRAFTKSFSIPGLRLGYALFGSSYNAKIVSENISEWNVSVLAQNAGIAAFSEKEYLKKARIVVESEKAFLRNELKKLDIKAFETDANYMLIYENRIDLYSALLKKGILIRDCSDYIGLKCGYYRIAIKRRDDNQSLIEALKEVLKNG